jgi:hypothetical protein
MRGTTAIRWLVGATLAVGGVAFAIGSVAAQQAAPAGCEDRPGRIDWDGSAGTGSWNEPTNWAADALPGNGAHVCIAVAGANVVLDTGSVSLASLQVAPGAAFSLTGSANLELAGPEPSTIAVLGVYGGTLGGSGTRTVTGSAVLDNGILAGNGAAAPSPTRAPCASCPTAPPPSACCSTTTGCWPWTRASSTPGAATAAWAPTAG